MRKIFTILLTWAVLLPMLAQQVPNNGFEDWSGATFDGEIQPASWYPSNVEQIGFKFNFSHREAGHTGSYSIMVQDQDVGAAGITETSPGYVALGQPWVYIESVLKVSEATAGTAGGIDWTWRPDTMAVWIRRTGNNALKEDYHLLYYSWIGQSKGTKFKGKNGNCTSVTKYDEESDVRQSTNGNECGTATKVEQVAEGWRYEKKVYPNWTLIKVPICYKSNNAPTRMNIIFSASNYPNFRANSGLYAGNSLYVDDVTLIYSSKIQHLYFDNKEWLGFDPNSTEEQTFSLGEKATVMPEIMAMRGEGSFTNSKGQVASFQGRRLDNKEMTITYGEIDGAPTVITVKAEDGSSTTTYKIKFVRAASTNAYLAGIQANGVPVKNFNPYVKDYEVELPYGTTAAPVITATPQEEKQTVEITQASSLSGKATIKVTAADKKTTITYSLTFKVAQLADNTLQDILVDGVSVPGFVPTTTTYRVSLPLSTTAIPEVTPVSAYPAGEQTIVKTPPSQLDGGVYQIAVTTPGNPMPKTYKLTFRLEASTYSKLKDLQVGDNYITDFDPLNLTYYVTLPMGTKQLPPITFVPGDAYQTIDTVSGGVDGVTRITVKAASGDQTVYKINFSTLKSEICTLNGILLDGVPVANFAPDKQLYTITLPIGTETLPNIEVIKGDEYEDIQITSGGVNGTTRITVKAGNGNTMAYQLKFDVQQASDPGLNMIYLDGQPVAGYDKVQTNYTINLPKGTAQLPVVTYDSVDAYQTINVRPITGLTGDYKITVIAQSGAKRTYVLSFVLETSSNTTLDAIFVNGQPLAGFDPETIYYVDSLEKGVSTIPKVTYTAHEPSQRVIPGGENETRTLTVIAESGAQRTYTILFVIQKSENAFLENIYLDDQPLTGFDRTEMNYTVPLNGTTCPVITVDKGAGQQVTITAPVAAGVATILVTPEVGAANTYRITFTERPSEAVLLKMIYVDGQPIANFDSSVTSYNVTCGAVQPKVTWLANAGQTVTAAEQNGLVSLIVTKDKASSTYTVHFTSTPSSDKALQAIYVNGSLIEGWNPATLAYNVTLPAGADEPVVTFLKKTEAQTIVMAGPVDKDVYAITVMAEDASQQTYRVSFTRQQFTDARLLGMQLDGVAMSDFNPDTYTYARTIQDGASLPVLTATTRPGQTTLISNLSNTCQQVLVQAENGASATYTVNYTVIVATNALLSNILLDGVALQGFDSTVHTYDIQLPERTTVVPCVTPVSDMEGQTVVIEYGRVNAPTVLHVTAKDGVTKADYTLNFSVKPLTDVSLQSLEVLGYDLGFDAEKTEYPIVLDYGTEEYPQIDYRKAEEEQLVEVTSAANGETWIKVTAQNGRSRTYHISFTLQQSILSNTLKSVSVNGEALILADTMYVPLAYASTDWEVTYVKQFAEQTVTMINGSVYTPTILRVSSNRSREGEKTYVIVPQLKKHNPAVLSAIKVNGTAIDNFDPMVYNYVVNVTAQPTITAEAGEGATVTTSQALNTKTKTIKFKATAGEYSNEYTVSYYYTNCTPPFDFTGDWVKVAKGQGYKPSAAWKVPADYDDGYTWKIGSLVNLTYTTGKEVTQSGNGVMLSTMRGAPMNGSVPGMMTLGGLSLSLTSNGNSTSAVTKDAASGITFRNTPEQFAVRVKPLSTTNISNWKMWLTLSDGSNYAETTHSGDFQNLNKWQDVVLNLKYPSGAVSKFNILLNSGDQENAKNYGGGTIYESDVQMVDLRFIYNSRLSSATIDGHAATISGTNITYAINDAEYAKFPELKVVGQVADQMQQITWQPEQGGVRRALVRNFGEDGSYTDYNLTITRTLSAVNTLQDIRVNGLSIVGFTPATTAYKVTRNSGLEYMPDIQVVPGSVHQTIQIARSGDKVTITVTPETGAATTYTLDYVVPADNNANLALLTAPGLTFVPSQYDYTLTAAEMPKVTFTKRNEYQRVVASYAADKAIFNVTAADGVTSVTYTVALQSSAAATQGLLASISFDGQVRQADRFRFEVARPNVIGFVRQAERDSVIATFTSDSVTYRVIGTEEHTYAVVWPKGESNNTALEAILLNGNELEEFLPAVKSYTIASDTAVALEVRRAEADQQLTITRAENTYTIVVTASDGVTTDTYTVTLVPDLSSDASLSGLWLDSVAVENFHSDILRYTVTIPLASATAPKTLEPQMPSVTYSVTHAGTKVAVEAHGLGETTYLEVTSADGTRTRMYELTVKAEPSHCAKLTGIIIDNTPISDFSATRYYYSAKAHTAHPTIVCVSEDRFQTYDTILSDNKAIITVTAQDGQTTERYFIDLYQEALSSDATLAGIMMGTPAQPLEGFDPMQNYYSLSWPTGTILPDVQAVMKEDGQSLTIERKPEDILLHVTAQDGSTNTYTLHFDILKSSNTMLAKIELDGRPLEGFVDSIRIYQVDNLPLGQDFLPMIYAEPQEDKQRTRQTQSPNDSLMVTITVIAEDGTTGDYTLLFRYNLSDNDSLKMLAFDSKKVENFSPSQLYYSVPLPVGTKQFPDISADLCCDKGDEWQTIREEIISISDDSTNMVCQYIVTAGNGRQRRYTVSFDILQSDVDTLGMIYINNDSLSVYDAHQVEYSILLNANVTAMPAITYDPGDAYQTVTGRPLLDTLIEKSLGQKYELEVVAQNGQRRTYTIHFPVAYSNDTTLNMIFLGGQPLSNFDSERAHYGEQLEYGVTKLPNITVLKKVEAQNVEIKYYGDSLVVIRVVAENRKDTMNYTITFTYGLSPDATLREILLSDTLITGYRPDITSYDIAMWLGQELPAITYTPTDTQQQVQYDTVRVVTDNEEYVTILLTVTAPNGIEHKEYTLNFTFTRKPGTNAFLDSLMVNDQLVSTAIGFDMDFRRDTFTYTMTYPIGTASDVLFTEDQVRYTVEDSSSVVTMLQRDKATNAGRIYQREILVTVISESGESRNYTLVQNILLSSNNRILKVFIDGIEYDDFNEEVHDYEYLLWDQTSAPKVTFMVEDTLATAYPVTPGTVIGFKDLAVDDDYWKLIVESEDGQDNEYRILFRYSDLNTADTPFEGDVLLQHIPGTYQIAMSTLRKNVKVGIYDINGELVFYHTVPEGNPNNMIVVKDGNGMDYYARSAELSECIIVTLKPNRIYFYCFFENDKKKIRSGKIAIR